MKKRKSCYHDMIERILTTAVNPVTRTDLFWTAKLGGGSYSRYIDELLEIGLVQVLPNRKLQTTEKGKKWLRTYKRLQNLSQVEE